MGVGMPNALWLDEFGSQVWSAFGRPAYLVGSALKEKSGWRDVDVRLLLDDDDYEAMGLGDPSDPFRNGRWVALTLAFSALGKQMTGLPIDFQIQQLTWANKRFESPRSALGMVALRFARSDAGEEKRAGAAEKRARAAEKKPEIVSDWQSIETAPKCGTRILLRDRDGCVASGFWDRDPEDGDERNWNVGREGWLSCNEFVHWMPLPPPPPVTT